MILTAATMKLEILLGGAPATNQLPFSCSWVDITTSAFTPGQTNGVTAGVTPVDLIGAPGASTQRQAKGIDIFNADTAAVTATVRLNDNGTTRVLVTVTLDSGDTLEWRDSTGWQAMDSTGSRKAAGGGGGGEANTASNVGTEGVGLFDAKVGVDLQFKNVAPGIVWPVTVTNDPTHHSVRIDSNPDADTLDGIHGPVIFSTMSTGLVDGGVLSIDVDATKFDIAPGTAKMVDNHSVPGVTTVTPMVWTSPIVVVADMGTGGRHPVYISMDSAYNVYQSVTPYDVSTYPDRVYLGIIAVNPATGFVVAVYEYPGTAYEPSIRMRQFFDALGAFNVSGNVYSAHGGDLKISKSEGKMFRPGQNYGVDRKVPDIGTNAYTATDTFFQPYHNAGVWYYYPVPSTNIDPENYDNLTNLTPVPTGKWTIRPIFFSASVRFIQYGQVVYDSKQEAINHIGTAFQIDPILYSADFVVRCYLIVQQGCTDLSDPNTAEFVEAGKFGQGSVSGQVGEVNTASNIGIGGVGVYDDKVGVDLQFKNIKAATSGYVDVVDNMTDNTIDLDLNLNMISHADLADIGNHSHSVIDSFIDAGALQGIAVSNTTYTSGQVYLSAQANITLGTSVDGASQYVRFSIDPAGTGGGGILALSGSNASFTANTATFGISNGITFYVTNGSMVASHNGLTVQSAEPRVVSLQGTSGSLSLVGASNVTVSALNGSTITIYGPANILNSLSVGGNTGTTGSSAITGGGFVIAGGSNVTLSMSNNSISIHAQSDSAQPRVVSLQGTSGSLSLVGASNVTVSALNGSTITIYGPANILNSFSIGGNTGTSGSSAITGGGFLLAGGNNITLSQSNNSISIYGGAGGAAGTGSFSVSGLSEITGSNYRIVFSAGANISLNQTTNGSSMTLGISASAGGAGVQQSYWGFPQETLSNFGSLASQGTLQVWPLKDVPALVASRADFQASLNAFTNATQYRHGLSVTLHMGLYGTTNATQLTLLSSGSAQFTYSNQSTNGSANNTSFVGMRNISIPITVNHDGKDLWAALRWSVSGTTYSSSIATGSGSYTSLASWSWFGVAPMTFLPCEMGANTTDTGFRSPPFLGYLSASTNTIPNSIALSHLIVSASASDRMYRLAFRNF
jgi:hypothetical protein